MADMATNVYVKSTDDCLHINKALGIYRKPITTTTYYLSDQGPITNQLIYPGKESGTCLPNTCS